MTKYYNFTPKGSSNIAFINVKKINAVVEDGAGSIIYLDGGHTLPVEDALPDIMKRLEKHEVDDKNGVSRYR